MCCFSREATLRRDWRPRALAGKNGIPLAAHQCQHESGGWRPAISARTNAWAGHAPAEAETFYELMNKEISEPHRTDRAARSSGCP